MVKAPGIGLSVYGVEYESSKPRIRVVTDEGYLARLHTDASINISPV